jgi:hypothetical protein
MLAPQVCHDLRNAHTRCLCHLEVLVVYLLRINLALDSSPDRRDLSATYLLAIRDHVPPYVDCDTFDEDGDPAWFDWYEVQDFCRDRKNATIVKYMQQCHGGPTSGHLPTICKYADVDDCLREATLYHYEYDELERVARIAAFAFLLCLRRAAPTLYGIKDMRRALYTRITDCSANALARDRRFALLFKPHSPGWK